MAEIEFNDVQKVYDDGTQAVFDLIWPSRTAS